MRKGVDVVVVGSIGLDTIRTPGGGGGTDLLGGSVSYATAAASFLASPGMVGVVGDDFPSEYVEVYRHFGVDLAGLQRAPGKTFRWSGEYEADMNSRRTLSTELNVFESFTPELPDAYREAPFLMLGNISPDLQRHVMDQVRRTRFVIADTMDLWINTARPRLMDVIGRVDLLMLNDSESRLLTGEANVRKAASRVLQWGPKYVVIKKGEHGAVLVSRCGVCIVPAYPVDILVDPTGAGDAFAGGFMGALAAEGRITEASVRRALLYGSVLASFDVEDLSLRRLQSLTGREIEKRLSSLRRMIRV